MEMHCRFEELQVLDTLGQGSFGRVLSVRATTADNDDDDEGLEKTLLLACKVFDAESDLQDVIHEISIMQSLHKALHPLAALHPTPPLVLIHRYHVGLSPQDPISYITMDLCHGGSLSSLLKDSTHLPEAEAPPVITAVAQALLFCHEQAHILHRDIKPANILFSERGNLDSARLADFGISVRLEDSAGIFYGHPGEGSRAFMAPEAEEYGYYSTASDVWGLGAVLFCMLTGKNPPRPRGSCEVNFDKAGDAWRNLSSPVRDLIQGMLCSDRHLRFTLSQVLQHPWLSPDAMTLSAHKQKQMTQPHASMPMHSPSGSICQPVDFSMQSIPIESVPITLISSFSVLSLAECPHNTNAVTEPQLPMTVLQNYAAQAC